MTQPIAAQELDLVTWSATVREHVEQLLINQLACTEPALQPLYRAVHYAVLGGGKRIRSLLVFATGELFDCCWSRLSYVAAAIELIHAYSLVHDDLPCMDNDTIRRGRATVHIAFNEATALLVGDALQTKAFEILSSYSLADSPQQQLSMLKLLAQAAGPAGMVGGQALDLSAVDRVLTLPELEQLHQLKTGALIGASVLLAHHCATTVVSPQHQRALQQFATSIGLAFQIVDDILDVEADPQLLGKTPGKDAAAHKVTYVSLLGLSAARRRVQALQQQALACLHCFDGRAERLRAVASMMTKRAY